MAMKREIIEVKEEEETQKKAATFFNEYDQDDYFKILKIEPYYFDKKSGEKVESPDRSAFIQKLLERICSKENVEKRADDIDTWSAVYCCRKHLDREIDFCVCYRIEDGTVMILRSKMCAPIYFDQVMGWVIPQLVSMGPQKLMNF